MDFLKNITEGKAFVRTEKGLVGVGAGECIEKAKVLDIQALLATKIFIESDGTTPEKSEDEKEVKAPVAKPKAQAPKCAKKINKPALD